MGRCLEIIQPKGKGGGNCGETRDEGGKVKVTFEVEGQGEVAPCGVSTAGWARDAGRRTGLGRRVRGVGCGVSAGRVKPKLRFSASLLF